MTTRLNLPPMKQIAILIFSLFLLQSVAAETTTSQVDKDVVIGTWQHTRISKTPNDQGEPLSSTTKISWTFEADGTGTYSQTVPVIQNTQKAPFKWTLEGNTLTLNGKTKYTVEKFDEDSMVWKNHLLGDYFHVKRI